ncbi:FAD-dependent oxidoreductase [Micromonospora sp. NPDC048930]|uniref:FAD-dependent oxidoreductase n=1 Tax=Micromonospora sp. NPDC048930 TaxID=3364261 RepID=UPI0037110357
MTSLDTQGVTVAVAGAGLAGLCLAQRLVRAGIDVHVYEGDPGPFVRRQGYRITVDADGIGALRASLPDHLYELTLAAGGEPGGSFRFTNSRLRDAFSLTFKPTEDGERQMDRQMLRSILLIGLDERVHYGKAAVGVARGNADQMELRFADGSSATASVVVAADGIGSALRRHIAPGADPLDSGMAGIYGRTPLLQAGRSVLPEVLDNSGVLALGDEPGRAFFFTTMRFRQAPQQAFQRLAPGRPAPADDDYVMWGLVLRQQEAPLDVRTDPQRLRELAARLASGYHPLVHRLIESAEDDTTILSTFAIGQRPGTWPLPRATVVGDAIHAMPPFGAHGGNTALRDAALLGGNLVDAHLHGESVESAIAAYQTEMPGYAFKAVDTAAGMMRRLTGSGRVQRMVMTRLLPSLHRVTVPEASIITA